MECIECAFIRKTMQILTEILDSRSKINVAAEVRVRHSRRPTVCLNTVEDTMVTMSGRQLTELSAKEKIDHHLAPLFTVHALWNQVSRTEGQTKNSPACTGS